MRDEIEPARRWRMLFEECPSLTRCPGIVFRYQWKDYTRNKNCEFWHLKKLIAGRFYNCLETQKS